MKNIIKISALFAFFFTAIGCYKDLNTVPLDPEVATAATVYDNPGVYKQVLAKLYAGFAVSGQQGAAGQPDIAGIDEGFGQYMRGFWYHQELPTDEAVIGWNDQTIQDFHAQKWTAGDGFIYAFYSRVFYQISLANEFLRETTPEKLASRGVDDALKNEINGFRAEARYLRALSYWHALDMFRNPPFATEDDVIGTFTPKQTTPQALFAYIESECLAIDENLPAPRTNEYARADKAAAWMLLAKLYLNAEVYLGEKKYDKSLEYCEKILGAGYSLDPNYQNLFLADNHTSNEIIFPIAFDGINTRTWGGMTFIIRAGIGGSMNPVESGVVSGWGGTRTTRQFIEKFPAGSADGTVIDFNPGSTVAYPKMYVPNSNQGFNAEETSNSLASIANNKIYEGYKYFASDNTELYFTTISSNTAPKWGQDPIAGKVKIGGPAIVVPQKGFYFIKVDLNAKTYIIEKRDWSIIGTATGGSDIDLVWDPTTGYLKATGQLSVGTFKFRANKNDAINLGFNPVDSILQLNEPGFPVSKAGGHEIYLDLDKPDYTFRLKFTDFDRRAKFYSDGQNIDINDMTQFTEGYAINKFKNVTSDGIRGKDTDFPDTDFPMFRLGDVYLMAAESILRMGGDKQKAVDYFNKIRERAYEGPSSNFTAGNLTLDLILDERARELYWECHRRTDLVRFGQLTNGSYLWAWKGGTAAGTTVGSHRDIFPIPSADLGANPALKQNPGY